MPFWPQSTDRKGKEVGNDPAEPATIFFITLKKNPCDHVLVNWEWVRVHQTFSQQGDHCSVSLPLLLVGFVHTEAHLLWNGRGTSSCGAAESSRSLGDLARLRAVPTRCRACRAPKPTFQPQPPPRQQRHCCRLRSVKAAPLVSSRTVNSLSIFWAPGSP